MMVTVLDVGDRMIKVTFFRDVGDILMTYSFKKLDANISNRTPTSQRCHQYISSPTFMTNIALSFWYQCFHPKNGSSIVVKKLESKFSLE